MKVDSEINRPCFYSSAQTLRNLTIVNSGHHGKGVQHRAGTRKKLSPGNVIMHCRVSSTCLVILTDLKLAFSISFLLLIGLLCSCKQFTGNEPQAGITVSPTAGLVTTERGGSAQFTVVLNTQPTAGVIIGLSSSDITEGTVSPASLTFTSSTWTEPQFVAVAGVDDTLADGDQVYSILISPAVSNDASYDGLDVEDVSITNIDDDSAGFIMEPTTGLMTTEGGVSDSFTIMLNKRPVADVAIEISSSDATEGAVTPAKLTFTPDNWDLQQTATVVGTDDSLADGIQTYVILTAPVSSADEQFNSLNPPDVGVVNIDDEECIAAGYEHTVALKSDGTLWTWGLNTDGQLGDGTNVNKNIPTQVGNDIDWAAVSAGDRHSVAIKTDGTLWAWGQGSLGQLGTGTWGSTNTPSSVGSSNDWSFVAAGGSHNVALKTDGTLWSWGFNIYGQLGDGTTNDRSRPKKIGLDTSWISVAAGTYHTVAVKVDGTLWAWGLNSSGQLGDGTSANRYTPRQIGTDKDWIWVEAGQWHTVAAKANGTIWAWGDNQYGQLGDGTAVSKNTPTRIGTDTNWTKVVAGSWHTIACRKDGTLWAWGYNYYGQLGDTTNVSKNVPTQVGLANTWSLLTAGYTYSAAYTVNNSCMTWGENWRGQLGDGTNTDRNAPIQIW
jgi:alpha-tubulin suppressor-like RCC1 family protein